jgi:CheY-like chemotaxis protein
MRILIADDNPQDREKLLGVFKPLGTCVSVSGAQASLETFVQSFDKDQPFKLACIDINMIDGQGIDLIEAIRQFEKDNFIEGEDRVVLMVVSELTGMKEVLVATRAGCDSYVAKPVQHERIFIELSKFGLLRQWEKFS